MPDRAVVERFTATGLSAELEKTPPGWSMDFQDQQTGEWWVAIRKADFETATALPHPRALVALSEDRQWLVVLEPDIEGHPEATSAFGVWKRDIRAGWVLQAAIIDTGQDAHAVLAEWMAGQG